MTRRALGAALMAAFVAVAALALLVTLAAAAEPSPTPAALFEGGDPRSDGAGPGLIGSPLLILLGVVMLGLGTAAVTAILVRFTRRD
jgi:hypothetical protein